MRNRRKIRILRKTRKKNKRKNPQPRWNLRKMRRVRRRIHRLRTTKKSRINLRMPRRIINPKREVKLKRIKPS